LEYKLGDKEKEKEKKRKRKRKRKRSMSMSMSVDPNIIILQRTHPSLSILLAASPGIPSQKAPSKKIDKPIEKKEECHRETPSE